MDAAVTLEISMQQLLHLKSNVQCLHTTAKAREPHPGLRVNFVTLCERKNSRTELGSMPGIPARGAKEHQWGATFDTLAGTIQRKSHEGQAESAPSVVPRTAERSRRLCEHDGPSRGHNEARA